MEHGRGAPPPYNPPPDSKFGCKFDSIVEVEMMTLHAFSENVQTSLKISPAIHDVLLFQIRPASQCESIIITSK